VQSRLIEARNAGVGVLLISFELDEIFACADRVLVIANGAFAGTFERATIDRGRIGALMAAKHERAAARRAFRDVVVVLVVVFGFGSIAMLLAHVSPLDGFGALFDGAFGTRSELAETLVQTTSLLFPALGVAIAARAGLFNIGADGQLILGGFAAGWLGAQLPLPGYLAIPMVLLAGTVAGGAWGAIAGFLRARFGANEVIATLMLNYLASCSRRICERTAAARRRRRLGDRGLPKAAQLPDLNLGFAADLGVRARTRRRVRVAWVLQRTVFGYELRAAGDAPEAAKRAGSISAARRSWR